jgi:GNAT superfamily N-acetyltransferase
MPLNIALRPAAAEEACAVAEVMLASRKAFLPYAPSAHSDAEVHQWVSDVLIPSGGVTVACAGALIVGILATSRDAAHSWIDQLYVVPDHVDQGIGSLLLAHALQTLPRPVRLHTFQANHCARSFYERHGFKAIAFTDGQGNEERCPDVLYELASRDGAVLMHQPS